MNKSANTCISAIILLLVAPAGVKASEILISAAASLTEVMRELGKSFTRTRPSVRVQFNFASSGALQQQIEQGAPVDLFAPASPREMNALQDHHHIEASTRINFAGNRLVLVAPVKSRLRRWENLASPAVKRVALSNPDSVPSGRYARETLIHRGIWNTVQKKAVYGENVRQTLTYVVNGDVDAGIVFATDAQLEQQQVRVVEEAVPGKDHSPIIYPAAVVAGAPNPAAARQFLTFLRSSTARAILTRYGFTPAQK